MELKIAKKFDDMESLCNEALEQIKRQQYESAFVEEGYGSVKKYGVCFYKKGCMVKCG